MTDLLMVGLGVVDSVEEADSVEAIDSVMTGLEMADSVERLIAVEGLLAGLTRTYVDVTEAVRTLIERWFDVGFEIGPSKIVVLLRVMGRSWRHGGFDRGELIDTLRPAGVRLSDWMKV